MTRLEQRRLFTRLAYLTPAQQQARAARIPVSPATCPAGHPADALGCCIGPCAGEEWEV